VNYNFDEARAWVRNAVDAGPLPAAVFGVATSEGVQLVEAFGDTAPDRFFALFSVTKPLVGLAVMRAVERGELTLDASLSDALASDNPAFEGVRLEHLLSHTAGLLDCPIDSRRPLREQLTATGRQFEPGTMKNYSNIAFEGIAAILEHTTGRDLYSHVKELDAFTPNGQLTFESVAAHPVSGGKEAGVDVGRMQLQRHPAAGMYANALGLLNLGTALLHTTDDNGVSPVTPATLANMRVSRTAGLPEPEISNPRKEFGLTFNLRETSIALNERSVFGHEGWSGTQWWIYPEHDAVFVLLTNLLDMGSYGVQADELNNAFTAGFAAI
jgi:CubicO group peptidase (beta-lactamase class C family)